MVRGRTALAAFAALATLTGGVAAMVSNQLRDATDVRGHSNTTWLSGEVGGRVVLGAVGAERPSVGVRVESEGDVAFDVVDVGSRVFVQNRATGSIQVLDGRDASRIETIDGPVPPDARRTLVGAGDTAFVVDPQTNTAHRIEDGNNLGPAVGFEDTISDWVGTSDGRLWVLDDAEGVVVNFDGTNSNRVRFADAKSDLVLTAVGGDAVVLDRTSSRLRWLRRSESVEIPVDPHAVVQAPNLSDDAEDCVQVLAGGVLGCYLPDGTERTMKFPTGELVGDEILVGSAKNVVLAKAGAGPITMGSWETGATVTAERPSPSGRTLYPIVNLDSILLDDPGSQYAITVDRNKVVPLDKLSKQTIVLSTDGTASDSVSLGDGSTETEIQAQLPGFGSGDQEIDDDGLNDPPIAIGDTATTRVSSSKVIEVLSNDRDPDGDLLLIQAVDTPAPSGTVTIVEKTKILFTPAAGYLGDVTFQYTIEDPSKLTDVATVTVTVVSDSENTNPDAADDEVATPQGSPIDIPVLANDTDPDGDTLNISEIGTPTLGSASAQAGVLRYEPRPDAVGTDRFTYTVVDGHNGTATATVVVTITAATGTNLPPVALPDRVSTAAGQTVRVPVLDNDSDPEGEALQVTSVGQVQGVTATIVGDGTVALLPGDNISGLISVPYSITDSGGLVASSVIGLYVNRKAVNRPPQAFDDVEVAPNVAITISPLSNDIDPDGDSLVISQVSQPSSGGSVSQLSPTTLRFEPAPNQIGKSIKFKYRVIDSKGLDSSATVTVQIIAPTGSGPVARDDSVTVNLGETAIIPVLANDSHPDGLPFNFAGQPTSTEGSQPRINSDSTVTYAPPPRIGTFTFSYTIQDANFRTSTANVAVNVVVPPKVNQAPLAAPDTESAVAGGAAVTFDVLANDVDPDGDSLSLKGVTPASPAGTATVVGGRVRFTPPSQTSGLVTFTYTISDGTLEATASVTVLVAEPAKLPPSARPDLFTIESQSGTHDLDPLGNDSDPEGQPLRISGVVPPSNLAVTIAPGGETLRVTAPRVTSSFTYNIGYTIIDSQGLTASSTVSVVVEPPPNLPPIAVGDAFVIQPVTTQIDVMRNDSDPDGGVITLVGVSSVSPSGSNLAASIVGNQISVAPRGYRGPASFTYTIQDPQGRQASASVAIVVGECAQPSPAVSNDSATAVFGPVDINVYANDSRTTGTITYSQPAGGTVTLVSNGVLRFTPAASIFTGSTTFTYTLTNSCDDQSTATVRITGNRSPNAAGDAYPIGKNKTVTFAVLDNDSDPDAGDQISLVPTGLGQGAHGATAISGNQISYNPVNTYTGNDSFTYTIQDRAGQTSQATVSVTIGNSAPTVVGEFSTVVAGSNVTKDVLSNDSDADGDALTVTVSPPSPSAAGSLSQSGGQLTFAADSAFEGTVSVEYSVSDGTATATGLWSIEVTAPNQRPTTTADSVTVISGETVLINPVSNDSDPDGDLISLVSIDPSPPGVTATQVGDGVTIAADSGITTQTTVTLSYVITDGDLQASGSISITIQPANQSPQASTDNGTIDPLATASFDVLSNDSDPDGDLLEIIGISVDTGLATATWSGNEIQVTDTGTASNDVIVVSYTVSDGRGRTDVGTLFVTVN